MFKRIFTDIPAAEVQTLVNEIEADAEAVERQVQGDGKLTIIATFPGELSGDRASSGEPPWMSIARAEIGVKEGTGGASNPRIGQYFTATDLGAQPDSVPWCSAFVNFCMRQSGIPRTRSGLARSWL